MVEPFEEMVTADISSLNAFAGQVHPRSLRLIGEVGSHCFQVLIDSGSTHNFIKPVLAERLGLPIQHTTHFRVYIGNGDFLVCQLYCPQVNLTMQGYAFTLDLFVLPIEGPDVVLGIQWLQRLGRVSHDYAAMTMDFYWDGTPDKFLIPTIDELLDELGGATIFSKLDLRAGYHQIRVHDRDTYKTAFRTHEGHYEFLVMPFSFTNAPSTFQATMNQIFAAFLCKFVIVFFNDILVYSSSLADHVSHLEQVLSCLHSHCFFIKLSKCFFCQETVEYLGHLVSAGAIRSDPQKIAAMVNWPPPMSLKQLRGFLGLTGYYRRFIKGYASIAAPLTDLLCRDAFNWTPTATTAFEALKQAMVAAPVLRLPNFELDFIIETDASNVSIGAVLMQDNHPISYYSKKLGPKLQVASTYIKELNAIAEAIHKWRQYLLGRFFIIRTDHKSIKELLQQVIQTPDQQAADALSRVYEDEPVAAPTRYSAYLPLVSGPTFDLLETLRLDNTTCPDLVLFHKRLAASTCLTCQQIKDLTKAPARLLQPLPIPLLVWDEVIMDFITGLPPSRGLTTILVVVERLTKSANFGALSSQFSAVTAADLFVNMVDKLHGFPTSIVSDRDPIFMSKFWKKLFELSGTSLRHSTAYHPQTDGQSEVVNRGLEQYLRAFTQENPQSWVSLLCWAEFSYNSSYHSGLKMTPFQALYGRIRPTILAYSKGSTSIQALDDALTERDALLRSLKENLRQAQHRMTQKANAHRRELQLNIGDRVLVRLQPYRQTSLAQRASQKLAKRYYGPFTILERVGPVAYKLNLPLDCKIHPVFHISMLKPFSGSSPINGLPLPRNSINNQPLSYPTAICATRTVLRHGKEVQQVLVQWSDSAPKNATWEDFFEFSRLYPDFHLEDKVIFQDPGNDTTVPISLEWAEPHQEEDTTRPNTEPVAGPTRLRKPPSWLKDYVV
ncbi:hypothetical protein KPL70_014745 [Citrus sinensis]|nr:hypothetical protein KPL70_014745 [Citrus sinensis]